MNTLGINKERQKESNLQQIIRLMYGNDCCTRTHLSKTMKLTPAAITKLVNPLIENGIIYEVEPIETQSGRKPTRLKLSDDRFTIVGSRINRDYVTASLYSLSGIHICSMTENTGEDSPETAFEKFIRLLRKIIGMSQNPILGIGVAVPGPFNIITKKITLMSGVHAGWERINIKERLSKEFDIPVFLEHDANCGAMLELWKGNHKQGTILYIVADRGVGAGIVIDGKIFRGSYGFAGEFGHMSIDLNGPVCSCGNHGCLELYGSTTTLERTYGRMVGNNNLKAIEIIELVKKKDIVACECYSNVVKALAFGCVGLVNILNPDEIVFSDRLTLGGDMFLDIVKATMKQYLLDDVFSKIDIGVNCLDVDPITKGSSLAVLEGMLECHLDVLLSNGIRIQEE